MKTMIISLSAALLILTFSLPLNAHSLKGKPSANKAKFFIQHLGKENKYQPLLEGKVNSVGIESGRVVKLNGQKGSEHSTKTYEEMLIILKGKGTIIVEGDKYPMEKGDIIYIPPHHLHQVINNDSKKLEYIYVAAPAIKEKQ